MMENKEVKGSITVFMTFIFILIFGMVLIFFESTRITASKGYIKNASTAAEKTLFGDYNMELFKEYGLFGYGGYNGISSIEMQDDFRKILLNNLAVKPKSSKSSYTDIYKIKKLNVFENSYEGLADGENLCRQIKQYIASCAIEDTADKLKGNYSNVSQGSKADLYEKLDDGSSYETGKYKENYEEGNCEGGGVDEDNDKNLIGDKNQDKNIGGTDVKKEDANESGKTTTDEDVENPLEVFKELVEDGYLSVVCDVNKLSEKNIEKAILSEEEENNGSDTGSETAEGGKAESEKDNSKTEYESAGDYLKNLFLSAGENETYTEEKTGNKDRMKYIIYADKVFSSYVNNRNKTVEYGMEYLICGNEKEKDNLAGVVSRIIATRMATNLTAILNDKTASAKALATATAIAGVTGIEPLIKGVQYVILAIMAFEESCIDVAALLDGRQIPVLKKMTDIKITYEEICLATGELLQSKAKQYEKSDGKLASKYIDYKEYLFCFAALVSTQKIRTRMFDIIQFDLRKRYNESFRIYDCIVAADFEIAYEMKFIFPYMWKIYGKNLKFTKFERRVITSYGYER